MQYFWNTIRGTIVNEIAYIDVQRAMPFNTFPYWL